MKKRYAFPAMGMMAGVGLLVGLASNVTASIPAALSAPPERIDVSRPSVITEVRSLGQLVSRSVEMEKIIEAGTWGGNPILSSWHKDHLLFIANGTVLMGFDLKALPEGSVVETESMITVNLGSPKVLFSRLDNKKSKVYEREVGLFNSPDIHLESRTRKRAEAALVTAVCQSGALTEAGEDGRKVIETFLRRVLKAGNVTKDVRVIVTQGRC